ncbi:MAG: tetratricopeptide repeat protein [Isosphaeraceae bacterium]|nr:tetratricopeptide repeat protein [Isosphaeraceae bacterium]
MSTASDQNPRKQKAKAFFQYGNDAALKNNLDYAIQMYHEAAKLDPESLIYRQALRGVQRRKFGNEPSKVGRLVGARVQPIRLRIKAEKAKGNWSRILEMCEEAFQFNPWDVGTSRDFAEAAEHLGLKGLARWALEAVYVQAGDDVEFLRHIARVYELNEEWQRAIDCWERVRKLAPYDEHAKRQINALSASATIQRSGLGEALHKTPAGASGPEPARPDAEELKRQAQTPEERLLKEIEEDPGRIGAYLDLADYYKQHNRLDEAEKILARGVRANRGDDILRTAHADVQISRLHRAIAAWTKRVHDQPDDADAAAKLKLLQEKLADYELSEYRRRAEAHPDDPRLHLEYGKRLAQAGRHGEAISQFQQARSSPELRVQALQLAGLSFEADGNPKLAERSYLDALKAADPDDLATINTLNYRLGRIYETLGNLTKAEEHYNEVAANDYGFQDVAQRLRNLHQKPAL